MILMVLCAAPRAMAHIALGTGRVLIRLPGAKVSHDGMPLEVRVFRTLREPRTYALCSDGASGLGFRVLGQSGLVAQVAVFSQGLPVPGPPHWCCGEWQFTDSGFRSLAPETTLSYWMGYPMHFGLVARPRYAA